SDASPSMRMFVLLAILAVFKLSAFAQSDLLSTLEPKPVAIGFVKPTSITHAGDGSGRLFVTERAGRIWILDRNFERAPEPFLDIRSRVGDVGGEQGLLSMAFHPDYASNGRFFVNYTDDKRVTIISQFVVLDDDPN